MKQEFLDYVQDMLESAQKGQAFAQGMSETDFQNDEKTQYAIVRALDIL
jgi:uncharacterized protein with HEPN domain